MRNVDVQKIVNVKGKENTKIFLEVLARDKQFKAAVDTPIGVELMGDAINQLKNLVEKVLDEKDTPQIRAEIRGYRGILNSWSARIAKADKGQVEFNRITTIGE